MISLICISLGNHIPKVYYITHKTKLLSLFESISISIYFIAGYYLIKYYSYYGLAIAAGANSMFSILFASIIGKKQFKEINFWNLRSSFWLFWHVHHYYSTCCCFYNMFLGFHRIVCLFTSLECFLPCLVFLLCMFLK